MSTSRSADATYVSTSLITITDLTDGLTVIPEIKNSSATTFISFDPNGGTYAPDFTTTNLQLTPVLHCSAVEGKNLITAPGYISNLFWSISFDGGEYTNLTTTGSTSYNRGTGVLTESINHFEEGSATTSVAYKFTYLFVDPIDPDNPQTIELTPVTFTLQKQGVGATYCTIEGTSSVFHNDPTATITLTAHLFENGHDVIPDATRSSSDVTEMKWFNGVIPLTSGSKTLIVNPSMVDGTGIFKFTCMYKNTKYGNIFSIIDNSDPFSTQLKCLSGTVFKNSQSGSEKELICDVLEYGKLIQGDPEEGYTFNWTYYVADSTQESGYREVPIESATNKHKCTITPSMVDKSTAFAVHVKKKIGTRTIYTEVPIL